MGAEGRGRDLLLRRGVRGRRKQEDRKERGGEG